MQIQKTFPGVWLSACLAPYVATIVTLNAGPGVQPALAQCELAKLLASDGASGDLFGRAVAVSGEVAVIGAFREDTGSEDRGAAYVFRYDGSSWVQEKKLLVFDGSEFDLFGYSVAVFGDTALIGSVNDDDNGNDSGSAYVFRYDPTAPEIWVQEEKLLASDGAAGDKFGIKVAISGDVAVVGASHADPDGAAYIFRYDGSSWVEEAELFPDPGSNGNFGESAAVSGDVVVVGAFSEDAPALSSGAAYVFRYDPDAPELWVREAKLLASDGSSDDHFGYSVSIAGDTVLIGARWDKDNGWRSGSAYVFRYAGGAVPGWAEEQKLLPSDGAEDDQFGYSVAVFGSTAVVGAHHDDYSGSAYVFRYDGTSWGQEIQLTASDTQADDSYGISVALSGNTAVIGASFDDDNGGDSGSAYVFQLGWSDEQKVLASDGAADDHFGRSVAVYGSTAVVGAPWDDDIDTDSGSAYVLRYNGSSWVEEQKLLPYAGAADDRFGSHVAVFGDLAVIGEPFDNINGNDAGAAFVFRYDGTAWVEEEKLMASDGAAEDYFGGSVAVFGDTILAGAPGDDPVGSMSGSAYLFRYNGTDWVEEAKLLPSHDSEQFGTAVGISGDTAVVGANVDDTNGHSAGSAYIFRYDPGPPGNWVQEKKVMGSGDSPEDDVFGWSVAVFGDVVVIGAPADESGEEIECGSAYIFRYHGHDGLNPVWVEESKLFASDSTAYARFGHAVAVFGDQAVIGAHQAADNNYSGSAYVFRYDGTNWDEQPKLLPSDDGGQFGYSVGISGDAVVIGADHADDNGSNSGSAYMFSLKGADCNDNGNCDGRDISDGTSSDNNGDGVPDECDAASLRADLDDDGDVDTNDFLTFSSCFNGSLNPPSLSCQNLNADLDFDGDVDVNDFLTFSTCFNGALNPPACP